LRNAIYVGRPTVWRNPYVVGSELMNGETLNAEKAVALYEQHLATSALLNFPALPPGISVL
jgi:hypothetical protein